MNFTDFPTPDFDCFDNLDDIDIYQDKNGKGSDKISFSAYSHSSSFLTEADLPILYEQGSIILDQSIPIKSGSNSTVYVGKSSTDGTKYALKVTNYIKRGRCEYEKRNLINSQCPYLLKAISFYELPATRKVVLQTEFCENGDIRNLMGSMIFWPEEIIWKLIHDISHALLELHRENWMHLDVSPTNILISNNCFKLSDFGTITKVGEFEVGKEGSGPYVSLEALNYPHSRIVNQQTDIFSLGVVLLEVASGKAAPRGGTPGYSPLRHDKLKLNFKKASASSEKIESLNGQQINFLVSKVNEQSNLEGNVPKYECWCSPALVDLINRMLSSVPSQRPTSYEICQMPQVSQFD